MSLNNTPIPADSTERVRILIIEDNTADIRLIELLLAEDSRVNFELNHAKTLESGLAKLEAKRFDLALLDLSLPDSQGLETFLAAQRRCPQVPFVVLSGEENEERAIESVKAGAQDYLVKGKQSGDSLWRVMRYAIERRRLQHKMEALNEELERQVEDRTRQLDEANYKLAVANQELERANTRLMQLDRMKSAFISQTSHELRTPVTTIGGMLAVLEMKSDELHPEFKSLATSAYRAAKRLENLTFRTLKLCYEGDYEKHLKRERVTVSELVEQVFGQIRMFVETRKQDLEYSLESDLPALNLDVDKIHDVILNLLMNSIKFTPDGGTIGLSARMLDADTLEFCVSDTGNGIASEDQEHIFEQFFSSFDTLHHSSGEYEYGKRGIGLGLAIVKKFVEMHGGQVRFTSVTGEGSSFYFTLPSSNFATEAPVPR